MKSKRIKKLVLASVTTGMVLSATLPVVATSENNVSERYDNIALQEELGIKTSYAGESFNHSQQLNQGETVRATSSNSKVGEENSVMPGVFYSELLNGRMTNAVVQIGSSLSELKAKSGEAEGIYDYEGGLRHIYGRYEYGVPYPIMENEEDLVTTVTYYFDEKPTKEEVLHHMGPEQESANEELMEYDYLWYQKDGFEVFFEYERGTETVDNVTVKWNRY